MTARLELRQHATIAIVGGGPAGAFTALHLLELARLEGRDISVKVFERRCEPRGVYHGCPKCAGGVSPRLHDALRKLHIELPAGVIQQRIGFITLQGRWKHIRLAVPPNRRMLSVFRGTLPLDPAAPHGSLDAFMLDIAVQRGATLINQRVVGAEYDAAGYPTLYFNEGEETRRLRADFVAFTGGVNENPAQRPHKHAGIGLFRKLQPAYRPPNLRKALICELWLPPGLETGATDELHFIESSDRGLLLDMCSILPKRHYYTISLIGKSVDRACSHRDNLCIIREFLDLPQIRRTLPPQLPLTIRCACNPRIVVGSAQHPVAHRAAVAGDMATCRQYKDGMLSSHAMAARLADTILHRGVDERSLRRGYESLLRDFRRDNSYAFLIFALYRWFFTSPFLSRVIYQTYSSERKAEPRQKRHFGRIFWAISSGDASYRKIAWWMLRPGTLWQIFSQGLLVTLKFMSAERLFGLNWKGIGRFPVAVNREVREQFCASLLPGRQFAQVYLYRIEVRAPPPAVRSVLAKLGERGRPFLNPRGVEIRRIGGEPLQPACTIRYRVFGGLIQFLIRQQPTLSAQQIRFDVIGGFADGGQFIFELRPARRGGSTLSVLLAFDYPPGNSVPMKLFWRAFRLLFPEFIHEALWNHALCELRQACEAIKFDTRAALPRRLKR